MALAPSVNISFPGNLPSVPSIAALRLVSPLPLSNGDNWVVDGNNTGGDGGGGIYVWNETSVAPDDGFRVIRPNALTFGQAGRWILQGIANSLQMNPDGNLVSLTQGGTQSVVTTVAAVEGQVIAATATYPDVASGEAATVAGQSFTVDNGDDTVTIYLRTSGGSIRLRTLPTTAALDAASKGSAIVRDVTGATVAQRLAVQSTLVVESRDQRAPYIETWDQRPLGMFRPPYIMSGDHGDAILRFDPTLPQEWRYVTGASKGLPIHAWNTPGTILEADFVAGRYWYNGAEAVIGDIVDTATTPVTDRIVDDRVSADNPDARGMKFDTSGSFNPIRFKLAVSQLLVTNSEFTLEIDYVLMDGSAFHTIADFVASSGPSSNRITLDRNSTTTGTTYRALRTTVTTSGTERLNKLNGNYPDVVGKKVTVRLAGKSGEWRLQDMGAGEVTADTAFFPTGLGYFWLGGKYDASARMTGYIQAVRVYQRVRRASLRDLYRGNFTRQSIGTEGREFGLQTTQNPNCITFEGGRRERLLRVELNQADEWDGESYSASRHRCELTQSTGMAWGTVYRSSGQFIVEEWARGTGPNDYNILMQHHGGDGGLSPSLAIALASQGTAPYGVVVARASSNTAGTVTSHQAIVWPGFRIGQAHKWDIELSHGVSGYLKFWADGVLIIDVTGNVGYTHRIAGGFDAGYMKFGVYRSPRNLPRSVHLFANVTGTTTTDISGLIANPLPIIR